MNQVKIVLAVLTAVLDALDKMDDMTKDGK